jgi:hypothetical protein
MRPANGKRHLAMDNKKKKIEVPRMFFAFLFVDSCGISNLSLVLIPLGSVYKIILNFELLKVVPPRDQAQSGL